MERRVIRKILSSPVQLDDYLVSIAGQYSSHRFLGGATQACYIRMVRLLAEYFLKQGRELSTVRVLDWGAGKGHITYLLKSVGFDVVTCDVQSSGDDSAFGQETPIIDENHVRVIALDHPWCLPFPDNEFDLVVSFGVLEHVANDFESLKELRRILKNGGVFFFSFLPYWLSWSQRLAYARGDRYHDRLYRQSVFEQMVKGAGFRADGIWHGQLLPKNSCPNNDMLERIDRFLTWFTPLKYVATNLEGILIAK